MLSQTVEYALRAMSCLAQRGPLGGTSHEIADAAQVPRGYLSKLMRDLVCAHLVRSARGRHGGFILARPPSDISVLDIVNAVDPIRRIHACPLGNPRHAQLCPLHRCLDDTLAQVERSFAGATLSSMLVQSSVDGACHRISPTDADPDSPSQGALSC